MQLSSEAKSNGGADLAVFWHHVGREHGSDGIGGGYASDLRKNSPEVVAAYQNSKARGARNGGGHRFLRPTPNVILELPPTEGVLGRAEQSPFVICYLLAEELQLSYGYKRSHMGWLIDIVDITEFSPNLFCVADLFVDIRVSPEDNSYRVLDMDDLTYAIATGIIDTSTTVKALRSLSTALEWLNNWDGNEDSFLPSQLRMLLREHAPAIASVIAW